MKTLGEIEVGGEVGNTDHKEVRFKIRFTENSRLAAILYFSFKTQCSKVRGNTWMRLSE